MKRCPDAAVVSCRCLMRMSRADVLFGHAGFGEMVWPWIAWHPAVRRPLFRDASEVYYGDGPFRRPPFGCERSIRGVKLCVVCWA